VRVIELVAPAPLQLGHDQVDEIGKGFRCHSVSEVKPVDIGVLDPANKLVLDAPQRLSFPVCRVVMGPSSTARRESLRPARKNALRISHTTSRPLVAGNGGPCRLPACWGV
jgi:hypothetical protein